MQHSSIRDRGETVDIFAQTNVPDGISIIQIDDLDVVTDITPVTLPLITSLSTNLKKSTLTLPTVHCTLVSFLNDEPVFIRVGTPKIRFTFFAGKNATGQLIPYEMISQVDGSIVESGNLSEYGYGLYGFVPINTGPYIIKCQGLVFPLRVPYVANAAGTSGKIYLQENAWQMLAIPKKGAKIYEDFVLPIETQTGLLGSQIFEVFNAYPYINTQNREFLSFVPGTTNPASKHNFQFIYTDVNGEDEISGFWCKTKAYTALTGGVTIDYSW